MLLENITQEATYGWFFGGLDKVLMLCYNEGKGQLKL